MASTISGPQQLQELIARLDGHLTSRRFKKALKTVDDGLVLSPQDEDLLSCRAGLLVEVERFREAIQVIEGTPADLQKRLSFPLAYARYRERDFKGALAALEEGGASDPGTVSLEAQVRYRLGQYDLAAELYERLVLKENVSGPELATNLVAAYVLAGRSSEVPGLLKRAKISPADGFELAFNAGCALLGAGDARAAQEMLALARQTGEEALQEEGLEDEEVAAELAAVDAQLAVAKHRLELEDVVHCISGTENTLEKAYLSALQAATEGADAVVETIVAHNLVALAMHKGGRREISSALARLQAVALERVGGDLRVKPDLEYRLGPETSAGVVAGIAAAAISSKNRELAGEMLTLVEERAKNNDELAVLRAAALVNEGKPREALSTLETTRGPYAEAARAQLAATSGDLVEAAALLRALPKNIVYRPGVVSTIAALSSNGTKKARGKDAGEALDAPEARILLDEARRYWTGRPASAGEVEDASAQVSLGWVLERLARNADAEGDLPVAVAAWHELENAAPTRWAVSPEAQRSAAWTAALAGAELTPGLSKLSEQLPRLDRTQEESLATATLAAVPAPPTPAAARESGIAEGLQKETAGQKKRRSRKRKVRYPKGYDPENPGPLPNPERWLPKWERSDGKKGRKKRRDKEPTRGSQGAGKVDESLDRGKARLPAEPSKPVPPGRPGPRKKGKGGRR